MNIDMQPGLRKALALLILLPSAVLADVITPPPLSCSSTSAYWCQSIKGQLCGFPSGNYQSYDTQVWYCSGSQVIHPGNCHVLTTGSCCLSSGSDPGCGSPTCPCPN